jgi:hypothetical protein
VVKDGLIQDLFLELVLLAMAQQIQAKVGDRWFIITPLILAVLELL